MPRSTANFISYDLRPAKQSERRILLDLLKIAGDCGLPIANYRYVGMGANRFYDYLLIHKYLGIEKMVSLEHDPIMHKRATFNCPYSFIDVQKKSVTDFLAAGALHDPTILWFDYDGGLSSKVLNDIMSLSTKLKVGDFCFVTVYAGPPRHLERENNQARLNWIQEQLGDMAGEVLLDDVERRSFPKAVHKVLMAAFRNSFSVRREGEFIPFLRVEYTDSKPMITIGGALMGEQQIVDFKRRVNKSLPFLGINETALYEIKSLHLTDRERVLFDRATTHAIKGSSQQSQLKKLKQLGFMEEEILAYQHLIRYLPRYVETIV